jgi:hypothetical protein
MYHTVHQSFDHAAVSPLSHGLNASHTWLFWELMSCDKWNHISLLKGVTSRISSLLIVWKSVNHQQYCTCLQLCSFSSCIHVTFYGCICHAVFVDEYEYDEFVVEYEISLCCDILWIGFFRLCIMWSEISSTLSCISVSATNPFSLKLSNQLLYSVVVLCIGFGKHFSRVLFSLFCVFTFTMKHMSHQKYLSLKLQHDFHVIVRIQRAHCPWHSWLKEDNYQGCTGMWHTHTGQVCHLWCVCARACVHVHGHTQRLLCYFPILSLQVYRAFLNHPAPKVANKDYLTVARCRHRGLSEYLQHLLHFRCYC